MSTTQISQKKLIMLKQQVMLALFICYIPHIASEPWWLFGIFSAAIGYRLLADYYNYSRIPTWIIVLLTWGCLLLLYGSALTIEFYIRCFLIFVIFKCMETYALRDLKVLIICNFYLIFSALIIVQELWIIPYLIVAIFANLAIMLKLSASEVTLKQMSSKSSKQLLIAIPLSILLFFVFPRIIPHWNVPALAKGSVGLADTMSPGSVSELFDDDSVAMQITFNKNPILNGYWRGIILSFYTGETWNSTWYNYLNSVHLPELAANETPDYQVLLEPKQKKWLLYNGYPVAGEPNLIFSPSHWLARQNRQPITQRVIYSLKVQAAPYKELSHNEYLETTQLPNEINPRLTAWAKEQFAKTHNDVKSFIIFLRNYIHQQSFWYTLTPPGLGADRNHMDVFWFDTQKGYCEHYSSAVTFILRAVGIPSRVILGYYGGQWNPVANAVTIHQNDAHAWLEYWQTGVGWQLLDPTSFVAAERIDRTIQNHQTYLQEEDNIDLSELSFGQKITFYFESAQYFTERWLLYYDPNSQQDLLVNAGLGEWNTGELLQASVGFLAGFFLLLGLFYHIWQRKIQDPLLVEYHLLQKEFRRLNIVTHTSATITQQCKALIDKVPTLTPILSAFFVRYEQLRLKQPDSNSKENKKETIALFRTLRQTLSQRQPSKALKS
jgi:transglutaminase-like putative cysteine protease